MKNELVKGGIYRHFKNKFYLVLDVALDTEDIAHQLVIYKALYDDMQVYAREIVMFTSDVDKVKYPEVEQKERFMFVRKATKQEIIDCILYNKKIEV